MLLLFWIFYLLPAEHNLTWPPNKLDFLFFPLRSSATFIFSFSSIFQFYFVLVSGAQPSSQIVIHPTCCPLAIAGTPAGTTHGHRTAPRHVPYTSLTSPWLFCNYQWYFSISSPLLLCPPTLSPLVHKSILILFVYLFCSLDSTYKWNHIFVFLWLTYFTEHNTL